VALSAAAAFAQNIGGTRQGTLQTPQRDGPAEASALYIP
jgi:hypothetical protein